MNMERMRTQLQTKIEHSHHEWTAKLQIYVTDVSLNREQTEKDIKQIEDLLKSMMAVYEKQSQLLLQK